MITSKNGVQAFRQALHLLFVLAFSINLKSHAELVRYIPKAWAEWFFTNDIRRIWSFVITEEGIRLIKEKLIRRSHL